MPVGPAAQGHARHRPQQEAESGGAMGGAHHEERRRPRTSRACIVSEVRTRPEISQLRAHVWVCAREIGDNQQSIFLLLLLLTFTLRGPTS